MAAPNLLTAKILKLQNLAFLICHLLADGHFRSGHILYDSNVFDGRLIDEIRTTCPHQVPWLTTDVTRLSSTPWQPNDRTDHILRLIIFDPKHLAREIHDFKEYFTFYRIFVFYSDNEQDMEDQISVMRNLFHIFIYDDLILHVLAAQNNAISIQWI